MLKTVSPMIQTGFAEVMAETVCRYALYGFAIDKEGEPYGTVWIEAISDPACDLMAVREIDAAF
ncbi:hypothetical protein AA106556_0986 [Neokomagataea tanensis NBRC 106556]|uniref:Uncharacterized protein n=1 Tax=Neokomagataea tanensis NBRC 106556 TaxID=1223519 RepID=A0ABQ0QIK5_9PROT|nr:hypothetical protein AA106556_0986 [Neokomagataea tanensis NBRC 106556]